MNPNLYLPESKQINFPIIGTGADGTCYIVDDKILKVSVFINWDDKNIYKIQESVIKNLMIISSQKPSHMVNIYDINNSFFISNSNVTKHQIWMYSYKMDHLVDLTNNEKYIFSRYFESVLLGQTSIRNLDFSEIKITCEKEEVNYDKVVEFVMACNKSNIIHDDIHINNIMKDNNNNFKLIDLDRVTIYN